MVKKKRIVVRSQGRIAIPKKIREQLGIDEGSILEVEVRGREVVLRVIG